MPTYAPYEGMPANDVDLVSPPAGPAGGGPVWFVPSPLTVDNTWFGAQIFDGSVTFNGGVTGGAGISSSGVPGAKGDGIVLNDAAITSGTALLSSVSRPFTAGDVGKSVIVTGAGVPFNNRGAWASGTTYALGDMVTDPTWGYRWVNAAAGSNTAFLRSAWSFTPWPSRELGAYIGSVSSGVASLVTTPGGSTPATAGTTVSGAYLAFGTDDTAAFTAFVAGGLGEKWVPNPLRTGTGAFYFLSKVYVTAGVELNVETGTVFRVPGPVSFGSFCLGLGSGISNDTGYSMGGRITGDMTFDFTGIATGNLVKGIWCTNSLNGRIGDVRTINNPDGSGVILYPNPQGVAPKSVKIGHLRSEGTAYGYNALQMDAGYDCEVASCWADGGCALNIEPDTGGMAKVVQGFNCRSAVLEARDPAFANAAVKVSAHEYTIDGVRIGYVRGRNGGSGASYSVTATTGGVQTGVLRGIWFGLVDVSGGGQGVTANGNQNIIFQQGDFVIDDIRCTGNTQQAPFLPGTYWAGVDLAPGMEIKTGIVQSCLGAGAQDIFQASGVIDSTIKLGSVYFYANAVYGVVINYCALVQADEMQAGDNAAYGVLGTQLLSSTELDGQVNGTNWATGGGTSTVARSTAISVPGTTAVDLATASGTQFWSIIHTPIGTAGIAVTAGTAYKAIIYGQAPTTLRAVGTNIWWYNSAGTFLSSSNGVAVNEASGVSVAASVSGVAPTGAAFAAVIAQAVANGVNMGAGEQHYLAATNFASVPGVPTQLFGLQVNTGVTVMLRNCRLANNGTGRWTGAGTVTEVEPRDPGVAGAAVPMLASAPTYAKGAMYFDMTLSKWRVGGATGWETVTSV